VPSERLCILGPDATQSLSIQASADSNTATRKISLGADPFRMLLLIFAI
jgi:hypothetical protein